MSVVKREIWIAWLGATAVAAVVMTFTLLTFAYGQFETKEHAKDRSEASDKRLERIEQKLDAVLERSNWRGPARDR